MSSLLKPKICLNLLSIRGVLRPSSNLPYYIEGRSTNLLKAKSDRNVMITRGKVEVVPQDSSLMITENAVNRLKEIAKPNEHLRIVVEGGGCSGFEYKLSLDDKLTDEDLTVEKDGAKVVVDKMSLEFIKGSTVDYAEEMMRSTFRLVNNPLADKGCSCGASFSVKM